MLLTFGSEQDEKQRLRETPNVWNAELVQTHTYIIHNTRKFSNKPD